MDWTVISMAIISSDKGKVREYAFTQLSKRKPKLTWKSVVDANLENRNLGLFVLI